MSHKSFNTKNMKHNYESTELRSNFNSNLNSSELTKSEVSLDYRYKLIRISEEIEKRKEALEKFVLSSGIVTFRDFVWALLYHPDAGYYIKGDINLLIPYDDYEEKIDRSMRDAAIKVAIEDMLLMLEMDECDSIIEIKKFGDENKIKDEFKGVVVANEYFTSLPFNLVDNGKEVCVKVEDKEFVETHCEMSDEVKEFVRGIDASVKRYPVCIDAVKCMDKISSKIEKGYMVIIDYGLPSEEYYSRKLRLACFSRDGFGHNPYSCAGKRAVAAPVDFTALIEIAEKNGMDITGFTSYRYFLLNTLGKDETSEPSDFKSIAMPVSLKVLIIHKNVDWRRLKCLQNVPAFGYWERYNRMEYF